MVKKIMSWEQKTYIFSISFVAGIVCMTVLMPGISKYSVLFSGIIISVILIALNIYLYYRKYEINNIALVILLMVIALFSASFIYLNSVDYSSTQHIYHFTEYYPRKDIQIDGYVVREPEVFPDKVRLYVKPEYIHSKEGRQNVEGGLVMVQVNSNVEKSKYILYGDTLSVKGKLIKPKPSMNPGGFNYRKYLMGLNVYGIIYVNSERQVMVHPEHKGNIFYRLALIIKEKMLNSIKKTMPFPESAFLGGITLGLRYGLEDVSLKSSYLEIKEEFKWAGVNHVLAVSGLHVTIITITFWGIFAMMKVPRKIYPFIIIFLIFLFTIITGSRPATMRAFIMHTVVLLIWALTDTELRPSVLAGVFIASVIILVINPHLLTQPSFTLSFGAVLALFLLTPVILNILKRYLVGYSFVGGILIFIVITCGIIFIGERFFTAPYLISALAISIVIWLCFYMMQKRYTSSFISFRKLPVWFINFFAAQIAIQIGMMAPLSSYYFNRYPIAGAYVNYLAIPLIGINVQLGILAGILSFIPTVGIYLALVVNAANFIFCKAFLWMSHLATKVFPYPYVPKPSGLFLGIYFAILIIIVMFPYIKKVYKDLRYKFVVMKQLDPFKVKELELKVLKVSGMVAFIAIVVIIFSFSLKKKYLRVVFPSVGYGNCTIIQTPEGRNILIDAGTAYKYNGKSWDTGERTVIPLLLYYGIDKLDTVIATNMTRDNIGGLKAIIKNYDIRRVILPVDTNVIHHDLNYEQFLEIINNSYYKDNMDRWWVKAYYESIIEIMGICKEKGIDCKSAEYGEYIVREKTNYKKNLFKELEIYIINPKDFEYTGIKNELNDKSITIKVIYGIKHKGEPEKYWKKKSFLLTSDICIQAQHEITERIKELKSDVMTVPNKGMKDGMYDDFIDAVDPIEVVVHFHSFKTDDYRYTNMIETMERYYNRNIPAFRTDIWGAVTYTCDGIKLSRKTHIPSTLKIE